MAINVQNAVKKLYSLAQIFNDSWDDDTHTIVMQSMGYDGQNLQRSIAGVISYKFDYNGGTNPIYIGIAAPGTDTSTAKWLIKKLTFDGNNSVTDIQLANGSSNFDQIWDNRAALSYA